MAASRWAWPPGFHDSSPGRLLPFKGEWHQSRKGMNSSQSRRKKGPTSKTQNDKLSKSLRDKGMGRILDKDKASETLSSMK